jgi:hypothetical protein
MRHFILQVVEPLYTESETNALVIGRKVSHVDQRGPRVGHKARVKPIHHLLIILVYILRFKYSYIKLLRTFDFLQVLSDLAHGRAGSLVLNNVEIIFLRRIPAVLGVVNALLVLGSFHNNSELLPLAGRHILHPNALPVLLRRFYAPYQ